MCLILHLTIPFEYPRSDNCEKCDSLKLKLGLKLEKEIEDDTNRALQVEQNLHLINAQQFYSNLIYIYMT